MRRFAFAAVAALQIGVVAVLSGLAGAPARAEEAHVHHHEEAGAAPVPGASLYQLEGSWTDARGRVVPLAALRGEPVALVLFYGTCESICPSIVRDLQKLDALLTPADRARMRFALVTIDPEVDTVERLRGYAEKHGLDLDRWSLLRGTPDQVRALAHAVGVRYRPTGTGQYSHTIRITLLDRDGVVAMQSDGLDRPVEPLAARTAELLAGNRTAE